MKRSASPALGPSVGLLVRCSLERSSFDSGQVDATAESPLYNPAFEIDGWGDNGAKLFVNGREIPQGEKFRFGIEYDVEGASRLIVYLEAQYSKSTSFEISTSPAPLAQKTEISEEYPSQASE